MHRCWLELLALDGRREVVRYLARRGQPDVHKAVIVSAVPPLMVKTAANPEGLLVGTFAFVKMSASPSIH